MVLVPSEDKRTFIQTEVVNYGDRSTTLTNITLFSFEKAWSWSRLRNRPTKAADLNNPNAAQTIPSEQKAGGIWSDLTTKPPAPDSWSPIIISTLNLIHSPTLLTIH